MENTELAPLGFGHEESETGEMIPKVISEQVLPEDFLHPCTGADLRGGGGGVEHRRHVPPLFFPRKKLCPCQKIQKHNINKIYQIEPRLKEMTCLMSIAETKRTFSAFQFFHKHY